MPTRYFVLARGKLPGFTTENKAIDEAKRLASASAKTRFVVAQVDITLGKGYTADLIVTED